MPEVALILYALCCLQYVVAAKCVIHLLLMLCCLPQFEIFCDILMLHFVPIMNYNEHVVWHAYWPYSGVSSWLTCCFRYAYFEISCSLFNMSCQDRRNLNITIHWTVSKDCGIMHWNVAPCHGEFSTYWGVPRASQGSVNFKQYGKCCQDVWCIHENVASGYRLVTVITLIAEATIRLVPRTLMSCLSFASSVDQTWIFSEFRYSSSNFMKTHPVCACSTW